MKRQKYFVSILCGILIVGGVTGYSMAAAKGNDSGDGEISSQETTTVLSVAEGDGTRNDEVSYGEIFKPYEQFGLVYNADKNELQYNGKLVRWFEDYYTIPDEGQAGNDFFNEHGVVDVYAVRDFTNIAYYEDGSFDPSGKLIGVKEFSEEEFAARDIESIKNPPIAVAIAGNPPSVKELEDMAKEYEAFGVTYDVKNNQWYFNGEKVRYFQDVLTSNNEGLTSGKFKGEIRNSWSVNGTIDIYTVRDFTNPNTSGSGTLIGIEKFSQTEFDERTQKEVQTSSGFCTVE